MTSSPDNTLLSPILTARSVGKNLHLKGCALAVLSRSDFLFKLQSIPSNGTDLYPSAMSIWELIESFHLAGACSVMFPLWGVETGGRTGQLAHTLALLRLFMELRSPEASLHSRKRSAAEALRHTQLWLRIVTASQVRDFLDSLRLSDHVKDELLEIVTEVSTPTAGQRLDSTVTTGSTGDSERIPAGSGSGTGGGGKALFASVLYWGALCISGDGGNVLSEAEIEDIQENAAAKVLQQHQVMLDSKEVVSSPGNGHKNNTAGAKEEDDEDEEDDTKLTKTITITNTKTKTKLQNKNSGSSGRGGTHEVDEVDDVEEVVASGRRRRSPSMGGGGGGTSSAGTVPHRTKVYVEENSTGGVEEPSLEADSKDKDRPKRRISSGLMSGAATTTAATDGSATCVVM
eukprot:gene12087-25339_t